VRILLTNPPLSSLPSLLPHLTPLVSASLRSSAVQLARLAQPSTNPSYIHRAISSLPTHVATLSTRVAAQQLELSKSRLAATTALLSLLAIRAQTLGLLVRALEAKHGVVARSLEGQAAEAGLAAQRQETEAQSALVAATRDTYTPEAVGALGNYARHLRDARIRVGESIRNLRTELAEYGVDAAGDDENGDEAGTGAGRVEPGKGRTMREMARVYREMGRQVDEVRADLERLGKA
jgi:hypothetical protein